MYSVSEASFFLLNQLRVESIREEEGDLQDGVGWEVRCGGVDFSFQVLLWSW